MSHPTHVAAEAPEVFFRYEKCPHAGSKVILLTIGDICVVGKWYGELGENFQAWAPLPKKRKVEPAKA